MQDLPYKGYNKKMKKQLLVSLAILFFLTVGTIGVVLYGKGYRFGFDKTGPAFNGTGLLVATSTPDGAQVIINGHLSTATNNTINLSPGTYDVEIQKDGYFPWKKKITVEKEVVSKADATLFPTAPKLENITESGVDNPTIDPSYTKIAYTVASQSARKNGVYVLDMSARTLLTLQSAATQITDETTALFSKATLSWSPDGQSILASVPSANPDKPTLYLLNSGSFNQAPQDVTETFATTIQPTWEKQVKEKEAAQIASLRAPLAKVAQENWNILAWSPDETKILYEASTSATIPPVIVPALPGTDSAPEARVLQQKAVYVYDIKEDKNFLIADASKQFGLDYKLMWLPDSKHLIYVHDKRIVVVEYDNLNPTTVYAGPFIDGYVYPWVNGQKVVVLTNLNNPDIAPNLYTIALK